MNEQQSLFEQLQRILLDEDRRQTEEIRSKINDLQHEIIDLREEFGLLQTELQKIREGVDKPSAATATLIEPLIEQRLSHLRQNFNQEFGYEVHKIVKEELKDSREEFIEAIYPIIGKIAKRYILGQFETFMDSVSGRVQNTLSLKGIKKRLEQWIAGISPEEQIILDVFPTNIEEVFIIHKVSGLLIGCYSANNTDDVDLIAGMLTAIKSFVEDTFARKTEDGTSDLSMIQQDKYKILISNFHQYYVATVVVGMADSGFRNRLEETWLEFGQNHMPYSIEQVNDQLYERISHKLKKQCVDFEAEYT
ncbi:MAG: hypothetical protein ACPG5B_09795 [Chitinophagales bacterium]